MKLDRLVVEQFDLWKGLDLPLKDGVTVLYGPNEAGKTTLKRFVQQVLFGFDEARSGATCFLPGRGWAPTPQRLAGRLELQHGGQRWVVSRVREPDGSERVSVQCDGQPVSEEAFREQVLSGVDRSTFETVFTFGLDELQRLATAEPAVGAAQLYELTVGPDGQRLLDVLRRAAQRRETLVGRQEPGGRLAELVRKHQELHTRKQQTAAALDRYERLWQERRRLEELLQDQQKRQAGMERELRGCRFLRRAWEPWSRLQQLRSELDELPVVTEFPPDGLNRLNQLDARLKALRQRRVELAGQAAEARRQLANLARKAKLRHLKPQVDWLREQQAELEREGERVQSLRQAVSEWQQDLQRQLGELGEDWTSDRVGSAQTSPEAGLRLVEAADQFRRALRRLNRLRRQYQRRRRRHRERADRLEEQLQQLSGLPLEAALQQARQTRTRVHELTQLRLQADQLRSQEQHLSEQLERLRRELALPRWVTVTFGTLGLGGAVVGAAGLWKAVLAAGWAGWAVCLAGVTCLTTALALRSHFAGSRNRLLEELQDRWFTVQLKLRKAERELRAGLTRAEAGAAGRSEQTDRAAASDQTPAAEPERPADSEPSAPSGQKAETESTADQPPATPAEQSSESAPAVGSGRAAVSAQSAASTPPGQPCGSQPPASEDDSPPEVEQQSRQPVPDLPPDEELLEAARRRVFWLERLLRRKRRVAAARRRLFRLRERFLQEQQELATARQRWCETVRSLGLDETLDVDTAVRLWQQVARAAATLTRLEAATAELRQAEQRLEQRTSQVERQLNALLQAVASATNEEPPAESSSEWLLQLVEQAGVADQERRRWRQRLRRTQARLKQLHRRLRRLARQRAALLVQAGASSREEFEHREACFRRRQELLASIEQCEAELEEVGRSETEFAVVEEDLRAFDPERNEQQVRVLEAELESLRTDLLQTSEQLGRVKQEMAELEADATAADLRLDECLLQQQQAELAEAVWVTELAAECFEQLLRQVERRAQPELLERASAAFRRLTAGRYVRVWRPLQERVLLVDQENGSTFRVEQLSRATREQLDLALRLALVEAVEPADTTVPLVLDDPLVNFDHQRAERAVRELVQVGRTRQVLYLTCHLHLARLFEACGASLQFLPEPTTGDPAETGQAGRDLRAEAARTDRPPARGESAVSEPLPHQPSPTDKPQTPVGEQRTPSTGRPERKAG